MARRASSRSAPVAPVSWRDGVHLTGTPIWCDARRRRDICFVSSAGALAGRGHAQLIGTPATIALLAAPGDGHLAVPPRQKFTLGTVRLQLIPSGRGLGAAALHADVTGRTVMYASAVRTTAGGLGDPAEVRTCDALVVAAPFGAPHHLFPPLPRVIDETCAWAKHELRSGRRPVLLVDSVLDALEVAATLAAHDAPVATSRQIRDAAARVATYAALPAMSLVGKEPRVIVWLDTDHAGLRRAIAKDRFATALVSGRAIDVPAGYDAAFAWSSAADRPQLLAWIEAAGAKSVFVTGACADDIATVLGPRARVIGPPHQMALFDPP